LSKYGENGLTARATAQVYTARNRGAKRDAIEIKITELFPFRKGFDITISVYGRVLETRGKTHGGVTLETDLGLENDRVAQGNVLRTVCRELSEEVVHPLIACLKRGRSIASGAQYFIE